MAILRTLRTNRILKIFTFIVVGIGMYLFVDPKFDVPLSIYYSFTGQERGSGLNDTDAGSIYGQKAELRILNGRGETTNPWNFNDRMDDLNNRGVLFFHEKVLNSRNMILSDFVWNDFITRSYVDYEMDKMGFMFSNAEQIDLYKGTITGLDNMQYGINKWWQLLEFLCNKEKEPKCIDTLSQLDLEEKIKNWREDHESKIEYANKEGIQDEDSRNSIAIINQDDFYRKWHIEDEAKTQKYFSIYQNGHFIPDDIVLAENLNENKIASGKYIFIPFEQGPFNFSPSDEDILDFYNNHRYKFINNKKTRELDYYIFTSENDDDTSVDNLFNEVKEFTTSASTVEGFKEQAKNYDVVPREVSLTSIMQNKIIPATNTNPQEERNIVRWAYGVNVKDKKIEDVNIGDIYQFQMYQTQIIFCLKEINEGEFQSIEKVRPDIVKELTDKERGLDIQKRIKQEITNKSNLSWDNIGITEIDELYELLAADFNNLELENIENVKYTDNKFEGLSFDDPELIGTFFGMPVDASKIHIGKKGVYILFKNNQEETLTRSVEETRKQLLANSFYSSPEYFMDKIITYAKEDESMEDRRFFVD